MKKGVYIVVGLYFLYWIAAIIAPPIIEKDSNKLTTSPPYKVSSEAQKLYNSLDFIADLHCDALLWDRDLTKKADYGHVDFPRMRQANVAIQAFTIVSKSPKGQNMQENSAEAFDNITLLSVVQGQPMRTWWSLYNRAIFQCEKLDDFADDDENFEVIKNATEFKSYLEKRKSNPKLTAGFLGVEGAHCLEGKIENVDGLFEAGVRMMAATHFFDNELGGSAHGESGEGLTEFGQQVVDRMNELGMIIDLAHISPNMIDDILDRTSKPVLVSHTGVKGVLNSPRNLSDQHIKKIATNGGLIAIAFFPQAAGPNGVQSIIASMKYVRDLVGVKHVALGSDYDGSVTVDFDITGFPLLVDEMLKQGFSKSEIQLIMGENVKQFLLANL